MKLSMIDTLTALAAVYRRRPRILVELIAGQLTADELREFGDVLAEAAALVRERAASVDSAGNQAGPTAP
ncbi:hypothetical protein L3Q65_18140 [Amycolatopsis sp. FU40]|nr:hypothetical protein L3Q65_18140 [Amycolatopsis sp. FU40]